MKLFILLLVVGVLFIIIPFILAGFWDWIVPDVFAGAVEQNILPATLQWGQAFKLMLLLSAFGLTSWGSSKSR